jgi:hypothetical protein
LSTPRDTILGMRWVTLGNHRKVALDDNGRVVRGLPQDARGVHVRDLSPFMREYRELASANCSLEPDPEGRRYQRTSGGREVLRGRGGEVLPARFETRDEALEALLRDNPRLENFVQDNWGNDSQAYKKWVLGGRRGGKPQLGHGDGRFDPINVSHNLTGTRRCSSYLEALYVSMPTSRRWEDLTPDQLWPLSECVGFEVYPPSEACRLPNAREARETCEVEKAARTEDLLDRAKRGRLVDDDDDPVPF